MCFGCQKELSHLDSSFEYPQHMFCFRNKTHNFQICSPGLAKNSIPCFDYNTSGTMLSWEKVKPVLSGHLKINKTKVLKTDDSLMQVVSIAECSLGPALRDNRSWKRSFGLFLSGCLRQVLLKTQLLVNTNQLFEASDRDEKVQDWSGFPDWALAYNFYNVSCFCWILCLNEVKTQF